RPGSEGAGLRLAGDADGPRERRGRRSCRLGGRSAIDVREGPLDLVVERAFDVDQLLCDLARPLEQRTVGAQPCEAEVGEARLPRAEQLPLAAQLEIDLGQLEPVRRLDERL